MVVNFVLLLLVLFINGFTFAAKTQIFYYGGETVTIYIILNTKL